MPSLLDRQSGTGGTLALILAGGQGERLYPLTRDRAKPAVPFGGIYRIIDSTLSNCVNSGLRRVYVMTQYKSLSLEKHIRQGWQLFNESLGEFIVPIPPQQRLTTSCWAHDPEDRPSASEVLDTLRGVVGGLETRQNRLETLVESESGCLDRGAG